MTRTLVFVFGLSLAGADIARAQIIQDRGIGSRDPIAWTSLSIGWLQQQGLCDGDSNACWDFGSAPQWRATLELPMGRGASVGAAATLARVPLIYQGGLTNTCPGAASSCDADANIAQYFGNVHIGGGSSFHQVIDVSAGMTVFSNFRTTDGAQLGPGKAVSNFSFAVGYGFGYSLSPRMQLMLVQEYGLVIHKRQSGTTNNTAQQSTTRFGARVGLGERSR